jgi:hypothetical protein
MCFRGKGPVDPRSGPLTEARELRTLLRHRFHEEGKLTLVVVVSIHEAAPIKISLLAKERLIQSGQLRIGLRAEFLTTFPRGNS